MQTDATDTITNALVTYGTSPHLQPQVEGIVPGPFTFRFTYPTDATAVDLTASSSSLDQAWNDLTSGLGGTGTNQPKVYLHVRGFEIAIVGADNTDVLFESMLANAYINWQPNGGAKPRRFMFSNIGMRLISGNAVATTQNAATVQRMIGGYIPGPFLIPGGGIRVDMFRDQLTVKFLSAVAVTSTPKVQLKVYGVGINAPLLENSAYGIQDPCATLPQERAQARFDADRTFGIQGRLVRAG
jgi:hypothetical protein